MYNLIKIEEGQLGERIVITLPKFHKEGLTPTITIKILIEIAHFLCSKLNKKVKGHVLISWDNIGNREFNSLTTNKIKGLEKSLSSSICTTLGFGMSPSSKEKEKVRCSFYALVFQSLQNLNYHLFGKKINQKNYCKILGLRQGTNSCYKNNSINQQKISKFSEDIETTLL